MLTRHGWISALFLCPLIAATAAEPAATTGGVGRKELLRQSDGWYTSAEARAIADNIVLHQTRAGGWTNWSNEGGMMRPPTAADAPNLVHSSLDDGATTTQLRILARVLTAPRSPPLAAAPEQRYLESFRQGFDYLLAAQYPNGGWPHRYPATGYHAHITFNDDTTYNVMVLLKSAAAGEPMFSFLDGERRERARAAADRGIGCILACQVVMNGRKTVWGAQHDVKTLAPAAARTFEPASLSASESVGLVRLLMQVERPAPEILAAVEGAVAWFRQVQITGIRVERFETEAGRDARIVADPAAPALWARFYELGTNRPIFCGRDAVIKYRMADIERERRAGYGWYGDRPRALLETEYPAWVKRHRR